MTKNSRFMQGLVGVLLLLLGTLTLAGGGVVNSQTPTPNTGTPENDNTSADLAVLVLIDQSRSVWGNNETPVEYAMRDKADPDGTARRAVLAGVLNWASSLSQNQAALGTPVAIDFSVMYFTGVTEDAQDWTRLRNDSGTERQMIDILSQAESGFAEKSERVNENDPETQTDFINAIDDAIEHMNDLSGDHVELILIVSDGVPCAPYLDDWLSQCNFRAGEDFGGGDRDSHLERVKATIRTRFNRQDQLLYLVQIGGGESNGWHTSESKWDDILGDRLLVLSSANQAGTTLQPLQNEIINLLPLAKGINGIPLDFTGEMPNLRAAVPIQPYRQRVTLTLVKTKAENSLLLERPDGSIVQPDDEVIENIINTNLIETWILHSPEPGEWIASSRDVSPELYYTDLAAKFSFNAPNQVQVYQPVIFELSVKDDNDAPISHYTDTDYLLDATVNVSVPGRDNINLSLTPGEPGKFTTQYFPEVDGPYLLTVSGHAGQDLLSYVLPELPPRTLLVKETQIEIEGLDDTESTVQGIPHRYTVLFTDDSGKSLNVDISQFEVNLLPVGETSCTNVNAPGTETGAANPHTDHMDVFYANAGENRVACVTVRIVGVGGNQITIFENYPYSTLTVQAAQELALVIREPRIILPGESDVTYSITDPVRSQCMPILPCFIPKQIAVEVQAVDAKQPEIDKPILIGNDLSETERLNYMNISIFDQDQSDVSSVYDINFLPRVDNPSIWSADLSALPEGEYRITVTTSEQDAIGETTRRFVNSEIEFKLVVLPNSEQQFFKILGIVTGALLAGLLLYLFVICPFLRRQGRAEGNLYILRKDNGTHWEQVWEHNLAQYASNSIRVPLTELPAYDPPVMSLRIVSSRKLKQTNAIQVEVETDKGIPMTSEIRPDKPLAIYQDSQRREYFLSRTQQIQTETE